MKVIFSLFLFMSLIMSFGCFFDDDDDSTELPGSEIYLFGIPDRDGNLGGVSGANSLCKAAYNTTYSGKISVANVKAFLSADSYNIKDIITSPGTKKIYAVKSDGTITYLKVSWTELFNTGNSSLAATFRSSIDTLSPTHLTYNSYWWSGSDADGSEYSTSANCSDWTVSTGTGWTGFNTTSGDANWIDHSDQSCSNLNTLVCVGWN